MSKPLVLDLFAGPGGWSEGLRAIGVGDVGLEWGRDACRTRAAAGHVTIRTDVARYPVEPFVGKVRGLIASPPCQAFSMAGKRLGMEDLGRIHAAVEASRAGWRDELREAEWADPRSALILEPLRWAWALRPEWIACEQVPPALVVWEHMASVLHDWGYDARAVKLNSADYGVPQTRTRAFLLAHREAVRVAVPTHDKCPEPQLFGADPLPWVSMAEALGWVPGGRAMDRRVGGYAADADAIADDRPAPTLSLSLSHGREVWLQVGARANATSAPAPAPAPAPALFFGRQAGNVKWYEKRPAPTITGGGTGKGGAEPFAHPKRWEFERPATSVCGDPRLSPPGYRGKPEDYEADGTYTGERSMDAAVRITLEEAAILQSFPPDYPFQGTKTAKFRQVGDAVPPRWAAAIISTLAGAT